MGSCQKEECQSASEQKEAEGSYDIHITFLSVLKRNTLFCVVKDGRSC